MTLLTKVIRDYIFDTINLKIETTYNLKRYDE